MICQGKYIHSVVVSCCMESHTREAAEAALEEELRPVVDKPLLDRTGAVGWCWAANCLVNLPELPDLEFAGTHHEA